MAYTISQASLAVWRAVTGNMNADYKDISSRFKRRIVNMSAIGIGRSEHNLPGKSGLSVVVTKEEVAELLLSMLIENIVNQSDIAEFMRENRDAFRENLNSLTFGKAYAIIRLKAFEEYEVGQSPFIDLIAAASPPKVPHLCIPMAVHLGRLWMALPTIHPLKRGPITGSAAA